MFEGTPEDYVARAAHQSVPAPESCGHCGALRRVESLGYYSRGLSSVFTALVLLIFIRRFRCRECGGTVSFLPNFAQPYRLVRNETVQQFFDGNDTDPGVLRWAHVLRRYAKRFNGWFPRLIAITGQCAGRPPPLDRMSEAWNIFSFEWGDISRATHHLVGTYRVTAFGAYRCHQMPDE